MKAEILASECCEKLPDNKGYLSTFIKFNRVTNEVIYISYHYQKTLWSDKNVIVFDTFQEVQEFLMINNN